MITLSYHGFQVSQCFHARQSFRGETPLQDYQQNPQNEAKLWKNYWQQHGFSDFEVQYLYKTDEFAINDGEKTCFRNGRNG